MQHLQDTFTLLGANKFDDSTYVSDKFGVEKPLEDVVEDVRTVEITRKASH